MLTQEAISRKDFLRSMGLGGAALMAVLTSCQNSSDSVVIPVGGIQIDLTTNLLTIASYIYRSGIIIARISSDNSASAFVAVSQTCTHEGTTIAYIGNNTFRCPNHGAEYNTSGSVTVGPATKSLSKYSTTLSGTTLTIS